MSLVVYTFQVWLFASVENQFPVPMATSTKHSHAYNSRNIVQDGVGRP